MSCRFFKPRIFYEGSRSPSTPRTTALGLRSAAMAFPGLGSFYWDLGQYNLTVWHYGGLSVILVKLGVSLRLKRGSIITVSVITVLNFEEYNLCMLDVRKPFADRTNHPIHPAGVTAAGPGSTPGGPTSTPGASTSTPNGPTVKKTLKPSSEETEGAMMKRFTEFLRKQNKATQLDTAKNEMLIKETAHECEKSMRKAVSGTIIDKITRDHEQRLR